MKLVIFVLFFLGAGFVRLAAAPSNDHFAQATALSATLPISETGTNEEATSESGEEVLAHAWEAEASVWWKWAPGVSADVVVSTAGSTFDTVLAVYSGTTLASLRAVAFNDDRGGGQTSALTFQAVAGVTYHVVVAGYAAERGGITLTLRALTPPPNDNFAQATTLPETLPIGVTGNNRDATLEPGERSTHLEIEVGASVWWKWTPSTSVKVRVSTAGSAFNTVLGVYTGASLTGLTRLASGPGDRGGAGSELSFQALAGVTYHLAVSGYVADGLQEGGIALALREASPPPNDDFGKAVELPAALPISAMGNNRDATLEADEPRHDETIVGALTASVWWKWTPDISAKIRVSTEGSTFFSVLAIYEGASLASLVPAANNDGGDTLIFQATAGVTYYLAVADYWVEPGQITLTLGEADPPPNDDFAQAGTLPAALPISVAGSNEDASPEPGEPTHLYKSAAASVWWRWTPAASGSVRAGTAGSTFDTVLAVYAGDGLEALTLLASNDDGGEDTASALIFHAVAGVTYHFAVAGWDHDQGVIMLSLREAHPPSNDDFAKATVLPAPLPMTVSGTNVEASLEPGEPVALAFYRQANASVWWRWTPARSAKVWVSTAGSAFDTVLAVYAGDSLETLIPLASNAYGDVSGTASVLAFPATAGVTYHVAVTSIWGEGDITLTLREANPPPNDDFTQATPLPATLPIFVRGDNLEATREPGEPEHFAGEDSGASVWWRWTPAAAGIVRVSTEGSFLDTVLAVYSGTSLATLTLIASDDQSGELGKSFLDFPASAGVTYYLAVAGWSGEQSALMLRLQVAGAIPSATAYDEWAAAQFSPAQLADPAISGRTADPDGDGLPNAVEYVSGLAPREAQRETLTVAFVSSPDDPRLILEFTRRGEIPAGGSLRVEESEGLSNWTVIATKTGPTAWTGVATVEEIPGTNGAILVRVTAPATGGDARRRFLRLSAEAP